MKPRVNLKHEVQTLEHSYWTDILLDYNKPDASFLLK